MIFFFYLRNLLLERHEVQVGDIHHVGATHNRQHPALQLPRQRAVIQQLAQLGFLYNETKTHK